MENIFLASINDMDGLYIIGVYSTEELAFDASVKYLKNESYYSDFNCLPINKRTDGGIITYDISDSSDILVIRVMKINE